MGKKERTLRHRSRRRRAILTLVLTSLTWVICLCFFLFQGGKTAFMLFIMVTILCLYLLLGKWTGISRSSGERRLYLHDEEREVFVAGDHVTVELSMKLAVGRLVPYVLLGDTVQRQQERWQSFESLAIPNLSRQCSLTYTIPDVRRGIYSFGPSVCAMEDLLGLFQHRRSISIPAQFTVYPQVISIPRWRLLDAGVQGMGSLNANRALKETTQFNGIREYNHGDRLSRIHWAATAKTGAWKSKEFERESIPSILIVLDCLQHHYSHEEQFELSVSIAASLIEYGRERHLPTGLLLLGDAAQLFEPASSAAHFQAMRSSLLEVNASGSGDLYGRAQSSLVQSRAGSYTIVVSPSVQNEVLPLLEWFQHQYATVSHAAPVHTTEDRTSWSRLLLSKGMVAYTVHKLQQLPAVLGGRSNEQIAVGDRS